MTHSPERKSGLSCHLLPPSHKPGQEGSEQDPAPPLPADSSSLMALESAAQQQPQGLAHLCLLPWGSPVSRPGPEGIRGARERQTETGDAEDKGERWLEGHLPSGDQQEAGGHSSQSEGRRALCLCRVSWGTWAPCPGPRGLGVMLAEAASPFSGFIFLTH